MTSPPAPLPRPQHAFTYPKDNAAHALLKEIIFSFKTFIFPSGEVIERNGGFSVGGWCSLCAIVLSGEPVTTEELKRG